MSKSALHGRPESGRVPGFEFRASGGERSADLQSAVSRVCNPQGIRPDGALECLCVCRLQIGDTADCKSALRCEGNRCQVGHAGIHAYWPSWDALDASSLNPILGDRCDLGDPGVRRVGSAQRPNQAQSNLVRLTQARRIGPTEPDPTRSSSNQFDRTRSRAIKVDRARSRQGSQGEGQRN